MGRPIRVLIVDDSTFLRHSLARRLEATREIVVVGSAIDGLDALAKVTELRPDVVVLDVEMPRMGGLEALQRVIDRTGEAWIIFSLPTCAKRSSA